MSEIYYQPLKLLVAGSRTFDDYSRMEKLLNKLTLKFRDVTVVSGAAKGADQLGEKWGFSWLYDVVRFHPDIQKHGSPKAYFVRNQEMVNFATRAVFFWDGKSTGTKDTIERARRKGMKFKVYEF